MTSVQLENPQSRKLINFKLSKAAESSFACMSEGTTKRLQLPKEKYFTKVNTGIFLIYIPTLNSNFSMMVSDDIYPPQFPNSRQEYD